MSEEGVYTIPKLEAALRADAFLNLISVNYHDLRQLLPLKSALIDTLVQGVDCECHIYNLWYLQREAVSSTRLFDSHRDLLAGA